MESFCVAVCHWECSLAPWASQVTAGSSWASFSAGIEAILCLIRADRNSTEVLETSGHQKTAQDGVELGKQSAVGGRWGQGGRRMRSRGERYIDLEKDGRGGHTKGESEREGGGELGGE